MKPILFVDGYNVIGAWPEAEREGWLLDESRDRLIHLLEDYAGYSGQEVVLVFDGHHSERPTTSTESRATLTIIDSHVTTIMAAVVLYQFGTGPVRGFAVTLGLGIVASLFTAVFVSHILFDIWTGIKQRHSLSV